MLELVFLGTAASAPSIQRGLPSQIVLYQDERFVIDCGEGTQRQILRSGLGFRRLNRVLLTHGHLDHILGLGGLISTFSRWAPDQYKKNYGGRRALARVNIELIDVQPGILLDNNEFEIQAFPVRHRGPGCLGYRFSEKSRRPFLVDRAEALGVPAGPVRRDLVNGQSVTLSDGRVVIPEDVMGPARPGLSIAVTGDTGQVENLVEAVRGVDLLVCEATYLARDVDMARRFGHITASESAWLAREAGARMLVLNHLSQRYRVHEILDEVNKIFEPVIVARDFDRFTVTRDKITLSNHQLSKDINLLSERPHETADM